ncbi:MAG: hypothetical protein MUC84_10865 [Solirubrobacteraceae bacterium]|nr:hypothetical protein [Solirubrobacteraceae bacterium]
MTSVGASSFVIDAPTLPAPNTPSAKPWWSAGYQAETQAMPTANEVPARPTPSASHSAWSYVSMRLTR